MDNNFNFISDKPQIPFEKHLQGLDESCRSILLETRNFVKSLGDNVIEEIRPHRIVYGKSIALRIFLDIEPMNNHILFSIRSGRKENMKEIVKVNNLSDFLNIKNRIGEAYKKIN